MKSSVAPGVAFAWAMHVGVQTPGVGAPMISVVIDGMPQPAWVAFVADKGL
jgi:hypothetical protein